MLNSRVEMLIWSIIKIKKIQIRSPELWILKSFLKSVYKSLRNQLQFELSMFSFWEKHYAVVFKNWICKIVGPGKRKLRPESGGAIFQMLGYMQKTFWTVITIIHVYKLFQRYKFLLSRYWRYTRFLNIKAMFKGNLRTKSLSSIIQ